MKKALLILLTFAECSKDNTSLLDVTDSDMPIMLGAIEDTQTKATISTSETIDNMGVFGYFTGTTTWENRSNAQPNYFNNTIVSKNNNLWTYSPVQYWLIANNVNLSFFAYAPHEDLRDDIFVYSFVNTPKIKYDCRNIENQID